jgi:Secretion system C-terminal sorting domain
MTLKNPNRTPTEYSRLKSETSITYNQIENTLCITQEESNYIMFELFDLSGKLIQNLIIENENKIDIKDVSDGFYLAKLTTKYGVTKTKKISIIIK